jgi:hypothetical protein
MEVMVPRLASNEARLEVLANESAMLIFQSRPMELENVVVATWDWVFPNAEDLSSLKPKAYEM